MGKLFTIGYGSRSMEEFIELLKHFKIKYLFDVRSYPYSKWRPEFNKAELANELIKQDIIYQSVTELGGYSDRDSEIANQSKTLVRQTLNKGNVAIMCSEQDPNRCHRKELGNEIELSASHIDKKGNIENTLF